MYRAARSCATAPGPAAFGGSPERCGAFGDPSGCTSAAGRGRCALPEREFLIGQRIEEGRQYFERGPARQRTDWPRLDENLGERPQFRDRLVMAADDDAFPGHRPIDVLGEARLLPELMPGDVLAFANAGAYGLGASAYSFHAHPAPAEVAFEDGRIQVLRARQPVRSVLAGQSLLGSR